MIKEKKKTHYMFQLLPVEGAVALSALAPIITLKHDEWLDHTQGWRYDGLL